MRRISRIEGGGDVSGQLWSSPLTQQADDDPAASECLERRAWRPKRVRIEEDVQASIEIGHRGVGDIPQNLSPGFRDLLLGLRAVLITHSQCESEGNPRGCLTREAQYVLGPLLLVSASVTEDERIRGPQRARPEGIGVDRVRDPPEPNRQTPRGCKRLYVRLPAAFDADDEAQPLKEQVVPHGVELFGRPPKQGVVCEQDGVLIRVEVP